MLDFIGVGSPLIDRLANVSDAWLETIPGAKGGMELIDSAGMTDLVTQLPATPTSAAGGSAANTTYGLARLGISTSFLGKLGKDEDGALYTDIFDRAGVNCDRFKHSADTPTGQCICLVTPDSERTMRTYLGAAMTLSPDEVDVEDFVGCRHAHIEGYVLFNRELTQQVLKSAKAAGCTISLDLASFEVVQANKDILDSILTDYVDIVFANEDEAKAYCGSDDPKDGLAALSQHCHTVAVKVGKEGAWLHRGHEVVHVPANIVDAIDTTGAGDLWAAGFLYGIFTNKDLATCGRYGAMTGAEVVQVMGASIQDQTWESLKTALA